MNIVRPKECRYYFIIASSIILAQWDIQTPLPTDVSHNHLTKYTDNQNLRYSNITLFMILSCHEQMPIGII